MPTIPQVAQAMQTVLTTTAATAARTSGFVQRSSKLTGAAFVQALVFGFLANPQATREDLAHAAAAVGVPITPQGLDHRMTETGALCLLDVLETATTTILAADPVAIPLLQRFPSVQVLDSSRIGLPHTLAHSWRGCGNQITASDASAGLKLSVRLDLLTGALDGPYLDHGRTSDRALLLQDQPIPAGGMRIADLGFFTLDVLDAIAQADGYWLSRLPITTALTTQDGVRIDLPTFLAAQATPTVDVPVRLGATHQLPCRLLAQRVPQEVADQRRRRIREESRRHGRTPNATALAVAGWTIFVTNAPPELLNVTEALVLGRARWQIELLFKLWKSQGQIDQWRSGKPGAILCELYAKVIAMLIQHWLLLVGCWTYPDRSLTKAAATIRTHALGLAVAIRTYILLEPMIGIVAACLAVGHRINKRKQTPHTFQLLLAPPEEVLA